MRVLVTGGTGFIGRSVLKLLQSNGIEAIALIQRHSNKAQMEVDFPDLKIFIYEENYESVLACLSESKPDSIVHLATCFYPTQENKVIERMISGNVTFGANLLGAMVEVGCKNFLNTSTYWQHYNCDDYNPVDLYAASKQAFVDITKFYSQAQGIRVIDLCLFDSYGPGDTRKKLLQLLFEAAVSEAPLDMTSGEQMLSILHVSDVANAILIALEANMRSDSAFKSYSVRNECLLSVREFVGVVEASIERKVPVNWGARPYRPREIMSPWEKGDLLPDWHPCVDLKNGISEAFRFFIVNRPVIAG